MNHKDTLKKSHDLKIQKKGALFKKLLYFCTMIKSDCEFLCGLMTAFSYKRSIISITFYGFYRLLNYVDEENICLFGGCLDGNRLCSQCAGS